MSLVDFVLFLWHLRFKEKFTDQIKIKSHVRQLQMIGYQIVDLFNIIIKNIM